MNLQKIDSIAKDNCNLKAVKNYISEYNKINNSNITSILEVKPSYTPIPVTHKFSYVPRLQTAEKYSWQALVADIPAKVTPENFLGGGYEAKVYNISDDYVLRIPGAQKDLTNLKFEPAKNIFEDRNFGQAVAQTTNGISINKKVPGTHLYKIRDYDVETYMQKLREYSELPDKTLDEYVSDIAFINSKGYRIDSNPENFLYDKATQKIGIIDIRPKGSSSLDLSEPYAHDWTLDPLVNGNDMIDIYDKASIDERKEIIKLITKLEDRLLPLCDKYEIPRAQWKEKDYRPYSFLNVLDIKKDIDYSKDLIGQIIYARYPDWIPKYEALSKSGY
ncbi:MAG: hypothetical protein NC200_05790 [Candidatus Gastranaerophilales bacterium]|nr:hypothetical protein [Candidatus Gastranaerophilales bacterium]